MSAEFSQDLDVIHQMQEVGRDLFLAHLVSSHGGNISVRHGDTILITRTGTQIGRLGDDDFVAVPLEGPSELDTQASSELVVHRALYRATGAGAVVHAHAPKTIYRSLVEDSIEPIDSEARLFLPIVPVVSSPTTVGSHLAARLLSDAMASCPIAVLRGHGPFSTGDNLMEAYRWVSILECSSELLTTRDSVGLPVKDYRE